MVSRGYLPLGWHCRQPYASEQAQLARVGKVKLDTSMSTPDQSTPEEIRAAVRAMRRSYGEVGLAEVAGDPIAQFTSWLIEAAANPMIVEANAMVLSTSDGDQISSRTVLLKDVTSSGFSFFTNYESRKAREMASHNQVSLLFPWFALERQVIVQGVVEKLPTAASDEYFATRPWGSQIGAWASAQSSELDNREALEAGYNEWAKTYPEGGAVPRPPHWGGYLVRPTTIELWQGRYSRLHDRVRYIATNEGWATKRFYP